MMERLPRRRIGRMPTRRRLIGIPVASIMAGSLMPVLPIIATAPIIPPFGFMMLIAWRLLHRTIFPVWAPVPLALFDDLISGQPIGSSMILWTLAFFAMDLLDRRMVWREAVQDWVVASLLIVVVLLGGLCIANIGPAETSALMILPQIFIAVLLFPIVSRFAAYLDHIRLST
jgi:rod shape-determining protein MreD